MTTEGFQRKLTAILSADVVGYSRLMGEDEEATVQTLNKYKQMIFRLIEQHNGRLIDSPGDNILAEFVSVVDAVRYGVQIQEDLKANNEGLPTNRKMEFRIGINIGDVIQDGDRIYGDGVNVAARIESLADPGGICISRTAYDQVKSKINIDYEYLGEYEVKNIKEPVRVYRIRMEPEGSGVIVKKKKVRLMTWQRVALSVVAIIILGAMAYIVIDKFYLEPRAIETKQVPTMSEAVNVKKTIAVLPFENLSSDPEQVYFVDGLSEEILNSLAQIPDLTIIARTSSFSFKNANKTIQEIANVLGVDNILEGSVRKAGNALRITAQLVKAVDGSNLWSKTYDRELKDIFLVQEDIATSVANELKVTLGIGKSLKQLGGTDNLEAYELYLIAQGQYNDLFSKASFNEKEWNHVVELINSVIALDPEYAIAWVLKAKIHIFISVFGPSSFAAAEQDSGLKAAMRAVELEPNLAEAYTSLGIGRMARCELIEGGFAYRKALELTTKPLSGKEYSIATFYLSVGYLKRANELFEEMRQNDPLDKDVRSS